MALTHDQKKHLFLGGGIGAIVMLIGSAFLGDHKAVAGPMHGGGGGGGGGGRRDHDREQKRRQRGYDDNDRGEYGGGKKKHHHHKEHGHGD